MRWIMRLNWTHLIRQAALIVFIWQYARWFQHYLLEETSQIVFTLLFAAFAIELLFVRLPRWLRFIVHVVSVILVHLAILPWATDMLSDESWRAFAISVVRFAEQFFPYFWFGLGASAAYLLLNFLLKTRAQVFTATVMSVIAFAITDSYTAIYLWDETALVVISGLILMVNRHFAEFRDKHPDTWKYLSEYPWGITLTAGSMVAFIFIMSLISPNVRPLLVDPYTAWNQLQGKSVNFSVKDDTQTAIASFGLNLVSTSGYSRDDSQLGGGFNYNYDPVFEVTTNVRSYWRGESKSIYTGSGWENPSSLPDSEVFGIQQDLEPETKLGESVPIREFTQQFRFVGDKEPPKIFGAYPISRIDSVNGNEQYDGVFERNMVTGAIDYDSDGAPLQSYTVTSAVPVATPEMLRQTSVPELVHDSRLFVQLPETLPQRVYDLVEQITADAETPYDKVVAIETYLKMNYAYTNTPDESRGTSEDFVDRFLFEIMEGYCDYFSTSMAVMVRTLDIPARWVKGYTSGVMDDEAAYFYEQRYLRGGGESMPEIEVKYTVRNADAHSWVEVYFEDVGWVMFEPTAGFVAPVVTAPTEEQQITLDNLVTDSVQAETPEQGKPRLATGWIILFVAVTLAVIVLIAWLIIRRTGLSKLLFIKQWLVRIGLVRPPANANEQIIKEFNRLLQYLSRKGLVRQDHQTVREVVRLWTAQYPSLSEKLWEVLHDFERAKYSPRRFTNEEVARVQASIQEIKHKIKRIA